MPDYHDIFWKLILSRLPCAIEFLKFVLKDKAEFLDWENLSMIGELSFRKKKLMYDILFEIPIRNSDDIIYFLIEHKSRRADGFELQILKYKALLHKWQKKELGKLYPIIPILFYQGLDDWEPEKELEELRNLTNPILPYSPQEILIFNLRNIDPLSSFSSPEMKAGMLLLKIIRDPWNEFLKGWNKILEILDSWEELKRIELKDEMLDYIFRSRTEENSFLEEAIMGKKVLTAYERAFVDGQLEKALDTARRMVEKEFSIDEIIEISGLSKEQLREHGII